MSAQGVKHSKNQWGLGPEDWNSLNVSANHTIDLVIGYHISTYTYNLPKNMKKSSNRYQDLLLQPTVGSWLAMGFLEPLGNCGGSHAPRKHAPRPFWRSSLNGCVCVTVSLSAGGWRNSQKSLVGHVHVSSYCGWKKSCITWMVETLKIMG